MSLPDLAWQIVYGRVAWTIVLAALLLALLPRAWRLPRSAPALALGGCGLLMALPGAASPAYWLGLALQYPGSLLLGLCLLRLRARWLGSAPGSFLSTPLAAALALGGAALYLDAIGWLSQGFYYAGFGPLAAPALALLGAAGCVLALVRGRGGREVPALLGALVLFSLLRLPTGNLWDALLDPLLWAWALATLCRRGWRRAARYRRRSTAPGPTIGPAPDLPARSAAGPIELFSISKEQVSGK